MLSSRPFPRNLFLFGLLLLVGPLRSAPPPASAATEVADALGTLIPKRETGTPDFLKRFPTYDGRGVVMAIFDTGVDPSAAGLQRTTTGEPKVIEVIDATGAGDVLLAAPVKPAADGRLAGRTGRTLTLPAGLTNPKGEFHLGYKVARELFGPGVMERIRDARRRAWDAERRELVAERTRQREADERAKRRPSPTKPEADLTPAERDVLARERLLDAWIDGADPMDPEPVFDCVVWNDGTHWRVVVDTDEDGDLRDETILRPYGVAQETGLFAGQTGSRYAVQVYNEGRLLSIVTVVGSHGTHVAGIAAAHFPGEPARNGIAPGAQIVSVKIGDTRLGSSADGTAYQRALAACIQHKVDVMNMSFGGPSDYQDGNEPMNRIIRKLVQDYGVTAFISVGNAGPGLSTLGAPGDTPEAIGVGAYVSEAMAAALYAAPDGSAETTFGFTSRGPAKAGHLGVDIIGPGAAIAPVAFDSLSRMQLMNGTSMSSPSVAGVGALLVSGAKQAGLKTTPARIKAALQNTAKLVDGVEPWAQGPGLAQVGPAFEHLRAHQGVAAFDLHFDIETNANTLAKGAGLYWRDALPAGRQEARFTVEPKFQASASLEARQSFEDELLLSSSAPWVEVPKFLHVANGSRPLSLWVTVPAAGLQGEAHYAEVVAVSARHPAAGPVFRIPVTVITPRAIDPRREPVATFSADLKAGAIVRSYLQAPADASHLRLRVRRDRSDLVARTYAFRATSLLSHEAYSRTQFSEALRLEPGTQREFFIPVFPGRTVELTWHQQWNSPGASRLEGEYSWIGLEAAASEVVITDNQRYGPLVLRSAYGPLAVEVAGKLNEGILLYPPVETRMLPGDERDVLPPAPKDSGPIRLTHLRQKFEFKVEQPFKAKVGDPRGSPVLGELLGGITRITHDSGRLLWHGGIRGNAEIEFPKGTITAYRDLRAIDAADVRRQSGLPLVLRRTLPPAATLAVYPDSPSAAMAKRESKLTLMPGRDHDLYLEEPPAAVARDLNPAPVWFLGEAEVTLDKQTLLKVPVVLRRGVSPPETKRPAGDAPKPKRTPIEDAREELYQRRLSLLRPLRTKKDGPSVTAHETLWNELRQERPDDPALPYERAFALASRAGLLDAKAAEAAKPAEGAGEGKAATGGAEDTPAEESAETAAKTEPGQDAGEGKAAPAAGEAKPDREATAREVVGLLDEGVAKIDAQAVAAFFGAPETPPPDDAKQRTALAQRRRDMTTRRDLLRDYALLRAEVHLNLGRTKEARSALLEAQRWEATAATPGRKWRELEFGVLRAEGLHGLALQTLQEHLLKDSPMDRTWRERRVALLRDLGWNRWAEREQLQLAVEKGAVPVPF